MEEKEFPKPDSFDSGLKPKISEFSRKLFVFIKLVLGICLLPFVYSLTVSFLQQLSLIEKPVQDYFWAGIIAMTIIYLFVWEPVIVYVKGQKILEFIFNFFKPLVRIAPYLLPVYTIILLVVYAVVGWFFKDMLVYFIFLVGLTMVLHLIFSAKTLRSKKGDFLKTNYIFGFSLIYILNLLFLAFLFDVIFKGFSFVNFSTESFNIAKNLFDNIFTQLFAVRK